MPICSLRAQVPGDKKSAIRLWDGNPVKSDYDDHYTTTDVINSFE